MGEADFSLIPCLCINYLWTKKSKIYLFVTLADNETIYFYFKMTVERSKDTKVRSTSDCKLMRWKDNTKSIGKVLYFSS